MNQKNNKIMKVETIEQNYAIAKARYAEFGIDTDKAIAELEKKLGGKIDFFCNLPDKIEKEMKSKAAIAGFGL